MYLASIEMQCLTLLLLRWLVNLVCCDHAMWPAQPAAPGVPKTLRSTQTTILCKLTWHVVCPFESQLNCLTAAGSTTSDGCVFRQAQWHADKAVRLHSPGVETALLLKCEALIALGKYAEALNETRGLTIQGDPMATEVLTVRAQALYLTGQLLTHLLTHESQGKSLICVRVQHMACDASVRC